MILKDKQCVVCYECAMFSSYIISNSYKKRDKECGTKETTTTTIMQATEETSSDRESVGESESVRGSKKKHPESLSTV
jgi:hypothetical protein